MELDTVFCPRCADRVRTTELPAPHHSTQANAAHDGDFVCLDMAEGCTQTECPLTHVSGVVMAA